MNILSIVVIIISSIVILLAIVFEGKLKKSEAEELTTNSFIKEIKRISPFGWILIILMLFINLGNSYISNQDKITQEKQFTRDTIKYTEIINQLERQRIQDSLKIKELKNEIINIGVKSDSIKTQVVTNAVNALNEQRMLIEKKKQNLYIQMVSEIEDNLRKIYLNYNENHIKGFVDTTLFVSTRLKNDKLKAYIDISSEFRIIEHLIETSESIDIVNTYAENVVTSASKSKLKQMNINMFLKNVSEAKHYLLWIYRRIYGLNSYKQYEMIDFSKDVPEIDEKELHMWLEIDKISKVID